MEILRSDKDRTILVLNSEEFRLLELLFSNTVALKEILISALSNK